MGSSLFSLEGRVALVTGGNSGIGREMALAMRNAGARVAIGSRRADRNTEVLEELGPDCAAFQLDVSDEASVEQTMKAIADQFGGLDILVNNAGVVNRISVLELERTAWDHVMNINVTGTFLCTKHAARLMKAQDGGKIVNISSIYGLTAPSKGLQVAYTTSKHAVIGLTKVNAVELAEYGIQVNAIAPGFFLTDMTAEIKGTPLEQALIRRTPSGHLGDTNDIIGTCLYLVSPASDHVTGMCIAVDGGYVTSDGMDRG
ncbi:MAG: glucose 1-dehydrogenase [Betaproteobacteria bacterium]|jgi:NAD(P)-dependent dehydrogenase (short-subunit alcohol dehydrogenase family)|nr:MAG: glucose 1-dehydrogenase [Betaproteobacteria bacterium]